jgi:hypothetical protein
MDGKSLDKSLLMIRMLSSIVRFPLLQELILSNSFVRRGDSTIDFGLVKDKASVSEA